MQHNFQAPTRTCDSGARTSEFETIDNLLLLLIRHKKDEMVDVSLAARYSRRLKWKSARELKSCHKIEYKYFTNKLTTFFRNFRIM